MFVCCQEGSFFVFCDFLFKNIPFLPLSKHNAGSSFELNWSRDPVCHDQQSVNAEKVCPLHFCNITVWIRLKRAQKPFSDFLSVVGVLFLVFPCDI